MGCAGTEGRREHHRQLEVSGADEGMAMSMDCARCAKQGLQVFFALPLWPAYRSIYASCLKQLIIHTKCEHPFQGSAQLALISKQSCQGALLHPTAAMGGGASLPKAIQLYLPRGYTHGKLEYAGIFARSSKSSSSLCSSLSTCSDSAPAGSTPSAAPLQ